MLICILDSEKAYVHRLKQRIVQMLPDLSVYGFCSFTPVPDVLKNKLITPVLFIYNRSDFPDIPEKLQVRLGQKPETLWQFWALALDPSAKDDRRPTFLRLGELHTLLAAIENWHRQTLGSCTLQTNPSVSEGKGLSTDLSSASIPKRSRALWPALDHSCIWFVLNLRSAAQDDSLTSLIRHIESQSLRIMYLPLMPTYMMHGLKPPNTGANLSDLLLRLLGDAADATHAGHFCQMHDGGWLQFRPPTHSDDLITADPATYRKLMEFLRQALQHMGEPTCLLMECRAFSFSTALIMASLADICQVHLPNEGGYARHAAQQEVNRFLNDLPNTCQIILPEYHERCENHDDPGKARID